MVSLRWLSLGRSLAAFAATPLLLLSTFARNASAVYDVPDLIKLAELREYVQQPRFHGVDDPADLFPEWYIAWRIMLQNQTDRLFLALEKRAAAQKSREESGDGVSFEIGTNVDRGFKIHVVGDSTMRMQANVWSWVLSQRKTADGRMQCISHAESDDANEVDMSCTGAERGVNKYGNPPKGEQFVLNLQYTKEFESCVTRSVDADFVYFGCGLHFLQIDPDRRVSSGHLDIWVHYERLLEEAVTFYRSGGGGNRIPMGEAFMTTHSFAADRVDGEYAIRMREYEDRYEPRLATCREIANKQTLLHVDWPNEFEPEEICTLGIFSQSGVANLNERAEKVMDRLGVPMVQGFDITGGQSWATPLRDGRHYPALIPMEISALLSEITTSLRRERREAAE